MSESEHLDDFWQDGFGLSLRSPVLNNLTILVDQEFSEVPWDFASDLLRIIIKLAVASQKLVDLLCVCAINVSLGEKVVLCIVSLSCVLFDLGIGTWLLPFKLVARESKDL